MAKIHSLKIKNFRGTENFEQSFGLAAFVCLIGRGDSGKTTILDAISYVLSPSWNLNFYDTDFYSCDVEKPIEIEVSLYDLPKKILMEDKYGLYIRGLDRHTNQISDDIDDNHEKILTIRLRVEKDLEPKWLVVNDRQEPIEIRSNDRANLNVFLISDYVDRHFSWNSGSPLHALLKQENTAETRKDITVIIDALREAKSKIDCCSFEHLTGIIEKIRNTASTLGINISNASTTIDSKDIYIKDGKICLHEDKIPFR